MRDGILITIAALAVVTALSLSGDNDKASATPVVEPVIAVEPPSVVPEITADEPEPIEVLTPVVASGSDVCGPGGCPPSYGIRTGYRSTNYRATSYRSRTPIFRRVLFPRLRRR